MKKRLYILVEGEDDVRFFGRVMKPLFVPHYDSVEILPVCQYQARESE